MDGSAAVKGREAAEAAAAEKAAGERQEAPSRLDPKDPASQLPPDAPETLKSSLREQELGSIEAGGEGEKDAIAYLLGQQPPSQYKVPVQFDTPEGLMELEWHVKTLDGKTIDDIEKRNTKDPTNPFSEQDDYKVAAEIITEATIKIVDPKSGRETHVADEEFRRRADGQLIADASMALQQRFHWQAGTMMGLAGTIRRLSGWGNDRVGEASRVLAVAAGNS